jgi:hypothetical protein
VLFKTLRRKNKEHKRDGRISRKEEEGKVLKVQEVYVE